MADIGNNANSLESATDLGTSPQAVARRWKLELKLADKRESVWRKKAKAIYGLYTPDEPASSSFNILWTNTETLRQAVYNSMPQPDVRRRYSDEDPLGKAVGEVLTRSLEFALDTYDFDGAIKGDVLAMLLPGRAVSRVRYVPDITSEKEDQPETEKESASDQDEDAQESESFEEIAWERVIAERVQHDDFRILCAAKTWEEVTAIGFRHTFTREDLVEKFGEEIGNKIPLDSADDEDIKKSKDVGDLFKSAEVWEIWDKDEKQVLFVCPTYETPCKTQDDPLKLSGFFPIPRPLYAIENDQTLIPSALFTQYEQQAKELNKISLRINRLVEILKVRGVYDSTISELGQLKDAKDGELVPAQNVTVLIERGGLEKAIWMMPIEQVARVLKELYAQRDATKQVIYEITGISDIMRSATNANETFGAQKIKTQWGTQRLQRMQLEVQRYIRDIIRIKAEIIAEKFQLETLEKMTLVQLPHKHDVDQQFAQTMQQYHAQVAQAHQQYDAQVQQAHQQAQQAHFQALNAHAQAQDGSPQPQPQAPQLPPPPKIPPALQYPDNIITWEKVVDAMHDDATRTFRVDIETDSTLSATQDTDLSGIKDVLGSVTQIIQGFAPLVQQGDMSIDVVKELILAVVRRAKMGSAVEDAIDKIQQPQSQPNPEQLKAQAAQQTQQAQIQHEQAIEQFKAQAAQSAAQVQAQAQQQIEQMKAQVNQSSEQARMQADAQVEQARAQASIEVERAKLAAQFQVDEAQRQHELQVTAMGHNHAQTIEQYKIDMEYKKAIEVAEIAAGATLQAAQISAANQGAQ